MLTSSTAAQALFDNQENLVRSGRGVVLSQQAIANATQNMTVKAKLATVGLKALSIAGNMLMMMGISMAISGIIKGFQALANAQENAIEKANEFINKFEEQRDKLTSNKQAIDSMSSDYEKLAKGVDSLGRNVSLNSDEYARYNEIVNQIADMFPHMVQGYTDEGNAIIKCKGDIEKLTQAYKDQKDAAQDAIIVGSAEVFAGFKASTDKTPKYIWEESGLLQMKELVDKIVATGGDVEKIQGIINDLGGNSLVIGDVFDKIGLDKGWFDWNTQDAEYISENIKKFQSLFNTLNTEVEAQAAKIKPIMQAYLEQSEKFQLADDKVQDMVKQIVGQFDAEFYNQFDSEAQMASWVEENVIDKLRGNKGLVNDFSVVFDLQTKFNAGDITVAEYQEKLTAFLSLIDTLPDETQKAIKLLFGITTNDDGTTSSDVDTMVKNVKDKFKGKFDKEIGQLKFDELEILADLDISPDGIKDWSEVEALIANAGKEVNKMTVSLSDLEGASDKIGKLSAAFKELSDDGYITTKTIGEIQEATGLTDDEWEQYQTTLMKAQKGSAEFNQVMSDLTYKILDNTFKKDGLVDATEDEIAAVLRENGVLNAEAVAHDYVTQSVSSEERAKAQLKIQEALNEDSIESLIKNLSSEAAACGVTEVAFKNLIAQMIIANETDMPLDKQILALQKLGYAADVARVKVNMATGSVKAGKDYYVNGKNIGGRTVQNIGQETINGKSYIVYYDTHGKVISREAQESYKPSDIKIPNYTGGSSSGGSKGSGSDKNKALDNYLKDAENRYKIHQDETKYINDLNYALNNLAKTEDERLDVTGKIDEAYRNLADNRIKDVEHQIELQEKLNGENVNVLEYYDKIQSIASEEADRLRGIGYDDNSNEIQELQNKWWDTQNKKLDFYSKQHENIIRDIEHARDMATEHNPYADITSYYQQLKDEYHKEAERLRALDPEKYKEEIHELQLAWWEAHDAIVDWRWNNSQNWISDRNTYNDWALFDDSEVDAWERVVKWLKEEYPNDLEKIKEAEQSLFEARKKEFDKANDLGNTYIESQKTLLQSYYDVTNSIAEAQHDINKELETSKTMYDWLDEDTRKLLFNQEDYNVLSEELYDIQYKADKLQRQYERDLENSTLSTVEAITSNYEMQYETLMKSYEIAKADLEIAKKKQKLNNVLNERNVRMFINGQWQWVANTEDVINAKSELADAEYAKRVEEAGLAQQESINNLTKRQDELSVVIKQFENGIIDLDEAIKLAKNAIDSLPSALSSMYSKASQNNVSSGSSYSLGRVLQVGSDGKAPAGATVGDTIVTAGGNYKIVPAGTSGAKYNPASGHYSIKVGTVSSGSSGGSGSGSSRNPTSANKSGINISTVYIKQKKAKGTGYTQSGSMLAGEDGEEIFIDNNGHLIPVLQPTIFKDIEAGGKVFNNIQMRNLESLWNLSNVGFNHSLPAVVERNQSVSSVDNSIHINGMTISEQGNEDWISGLKRFTYTHGGRM